LRVDPGDEGEQLIPREACRLRGGDRGDGTGICRDDEPVNVIAVATAPNRGDPRRTAAPTTSAPIAPKTDDSEMNSSPNWAPTGFCTIAAALCGMSPQAT